MKDIELPVGYIVVSDGSLSDRIAAAASLPFDEHEKIPIRAVVFDSHDQGVLLLLVLDHAACDASSIRSLMTDLVAAYNARRQGRPPQWSREPMRYLDYVASQRRMLEQADNPNSLWGRQLGYWSQVFARPVCQLDLAALSRQLGFWSLALGSAIKIPRAVRAVDEVPGRTAAVSAKIGPGIHQQVADVAREGRATTFMVLHAAVAALLTTLGAGSDVLMAAVVSGRADSRVTQLVGPLENAVPLRTDTSGDPPFRELVSRIRQADLNALASQDVPIEILRERVQPSGSALDVMLSFRGPAVTAADVDGQSSTITEGSSFRGTFQLLFSFSERRTRAGAPAGIDCRIEYSVHRFVPGIMRALLHHFGGILIGGVNDPAERISALLEQSYRTTISTNASPTTHVLDVSSMASSRTPSGGRALAEPRDALQDRLVDLWEHVLETDPVGIDDDFFDLGGTSQLADAMVRQLQLLYGEEVNLAAIGRPLTIQKVAEALIATIPSRTLLEIQRGDPPVKTPLFFIHGDVGGGGFYVRELAGALRAEQPVYVLQQHGIHPVDLPDSIEEMAEHHVKVLREFRPRGPYCLAGYCSGAAIAFEAARRLVQEGDQVTAVFLLDPRFGIRRHIYKNGPLPLLRLAPEQMRLPRVRGPWLFTQYVQIVLRYRPRVYSGRVIVLLASDRAADARDILAGYGGLAADAELRVVPGTHISLVGRHVLATAAEIRAHLESAQDT